MHKRAMHFLDPKNAGQSDTDISRPENQLALDRDPLDELHLSRSIPLE